MVENGEAAADNRYMCFDDGLDVNDELRLDAACVQFERCWRAGDPPDIEEFLEDHDGNLRAELLRQLILLDMEYRASRDEPPQAADYIARFPRDASWIPTLFEDHAVLPRSEHVRSDGHLTATEIESAPNLDEPRNIGHFRLQEEVGTGGFGSVWRAVDQKLDRPVAIKLPRKGQLTGREREIFRREAQTAAQLSHPNIVSVHEVGVAENAIYIVSDFIEGSTLNDPRLRNALDFDEVATMMIKVARALAHAHACGVVHRDLKPGNILVDQNGEPHLTDFGLAKREGGDATLTIEGSLVGSPAYMSPEQARGQGHSADAASDVYSFGVVVYELLTGELPFRGSIEMLLRQIADDDEPPPPRRLNQRIPRDLETICLKCLEKGRERRYSSANLVADELQRFLDKEPIRARPIGQVHRLVRWCQRRPVIALLSMMVLVTTALGFGGVLWQWQQTRSARDQTAAERDNATWQSYLANMRAASTAMNVGNVNLARQSLQAAPAAHRDWEWKHFTSRLDGSSRILAGHSDHIEGVCFTGTGDKLFSVSRDRTIRVWDAHQGKQLDLWQSGPACGYMQLSADGQRLACSSDRDVFLWDTQTGDKIATLSQHQSGRFVRTVFHPDSRSFVTCCHGDNVIYHFDAVSGRQIGSFVSENDRTAMVGYHVGKGEYVVIHTTGDVQFLDDELQPTTALPSGSDRADPVSFDMSEDGRWLAIGHYWPVNKATLWDLEQQRQHVLLGHENSVDGVAFAPDGSRLLSVSPDQTARLWNTQQAELVAVMSGHSEVLHDTIVFAGNGAHALTASQDKTIRIWDSGSGELISVLMGHADGVYYMDISPDGRLLASGDGLGMIRVWSLDSTEQVLRGHKSFVYDCIISPNGEWIASCGWDNTLRLWQTQTGANRVWQSPTEVPLFTVAFHPDGAQVAAAARNKIYLVDVQQNTTQHALPVEQSLAATKCLAYHPSGTLLAAGTSQGTVCCWDPHRGDPVGDWNAHDSPIAGLTFSHDGAFLVTGDDAGRLVVWDTTDRHSIAELLGHQGQVTAIQFGTSDTWLASASVDGTVRIWDTRTWQPEAVLEHHCRIYDVAFHPDGSRLASGCADNTVRLWDTRTWQEVAQVGGHHVFVHAVDFSRDGTRLISGSGDKTIRLWDTPR